MNYSRFLNSLSLARKPSALRELTKLLASASPTTVFLATGLPNSQLFPFQSATVTLKDGSSLQISENKMSDALQYIPTQGYGPLLSQLKELQYKLHSPPQWSNSELVITHGSQDGLCKAFEMMLDINDYVVVEEPLYAGTLGILGPYKPKYIAVEGDAFGIVPDTLRRALNSVKQSEEAEANYPKVLYINPTGANPTGTSLPLERRKDIYKIAQDFDLIILEDDPYYFVQFEKDRIPSFLSLDVDGRVLRFDSFSKVLSSGIRLGFVTGPRQLVERIVFHMQVSILHASTLSQVLVSELLAKWGIEGFLEHTIKVQEFYQQRRDKMLESAEKHLKGLVEYNIPNGGMFLWMKCRNIPDTKMMIMERALKKEIVLVPGRDFMTDRSKPSQFMRASFSLASVEDVDRGFRNLAELIREEESMNQ